MRYTVVVTRPQREFECKRELTEKFAVDGSGEVDVFLPVLKIRKKTRFAKKPTVFDRPLFGNYLFVAFEQEDRWKQLHAAWSVVTVLKNCGQPLYVGENVMAAIKRSDWFVDTLAKNKMRFGLGEKVRVKEGPFQSALATVTGPTSVDIMVFGRMTKVTVDHEWLEAV